MLAAVILALAGFIAGGHRTAHPGAGLVLGLSGSGVGLALHARVRGSNGLPREWAGSGFRTGSGLVFGPGAWWVREFDLFVCQFVLG